MVRGEAWWKEGGTWVRGRPEDYFSPAGKVLALVGGGGKTSLMYCLAAGFQRMGIDAAAMTTTRIWRPDDLCRTAKDCLSRWEAGRFALCGQDAPQAGKLMAPEDHVYRWLLEHSGVLLVEADGARGLPCKAPADHEPVLPKECSCVLAVMGLDALGGPVGEVCFRPELVCALLGCTPEHRLTPEDAAELLLSIRGARKDVGARKYCVVLNKCDDVERLRQGKELAGLLESRGHAETVLTRLR